MTVLYIALYIAIARALVTSPNIILADEPTGNLDRENGQRIMSILKDIHHTGQTILMVTHDLELVNMANSQINMLDGRLVS